MREVGKIGDEAKARRLVDYLTAQDISAEARRAGEGWAIWIHREDQVQRGRQEVDAFAANPDDPKYEGSGRIAREKRREAERIEREHRKRTVALRDRINVISPRRCPVTHALIGLSILTWVITELGGPPRADRAQRGQTSWRGQILDLLYFAPPRVVEEDRTVLSPDGTPETSRIRVVRASLEPLLHGQIWRLWTPTFIHYGLAHLAFNMMALYWFGGRIELRKNPRILLLLVLTSAPVSLLAEHIWDIYWSPGVVALPGGMSGVVYALFGYVWMKSDFEPESHLRIHSNSILWMLIWLFLCMVGWMGPIANAAHVAGLVFGILAGLGPHIRDGLPWR